MDGPELLLCDRCNVSLQRGRGQFFIVLIHAVADPSAPELDAYDTEIAALRKQYLELIAASKNKSEAEAMHEVFAKRTLTLCCPCYEVWLENPCSTEPPP